MRLATRFRHEREHQVRHENEQISNREFTVIRLRATKYQLAFTLGCIFALPIVFVFLFLIALFGTKSPPTYVTVFLLLVPVVMVFSYGSVATELTIENDGRMTGYSLFRKKCIHIADIRSIDIRRWNRGFIYVWTQNTRLFMYRDMPGAIEAVKKIAKDNPEIVLRQ